MPGVAVNGVFLQACSEEEEEVSYLVLVVVLHSVFSPVCTRSSPSSYWSHPGSLGRMYLPLSRFGRYPYYPLHLHLFFFSSPLLRPNTESSFDSPLASYIFLSSFPPPCTLSLVHLPQTTYLCISCKYALPVLHPLPTQLREDQGSCWLG